MKNVILCCLIIILAGVPAMASDTITDWAVDRTDIAWEATPLNYLESATSDESVIWVGSIEETNVYYNNNNEIVMEFLCRHLSIADSDAGEVEESIRVQDLNSGYFVISFSSASLPIEQASEYCTKVKETQHFVAVLGSPVGPSSSFGDDGIYVQSEKAVISDKFLVNIIE